MNLKHLYQVRHLEDELLDSIMLWFFSLCACLQVAAVAALFVQTEPSYRPLIADVVHSLVPLVPVEFGGPLRTQDSTSDAKSLSAVQSFAYGPATAVQ